MIAFPNAKINIGLHILNKRPDGFHEIETIFFPTNLCDILEVTEANGKSSSFEYTGIPIPGLTENNSCSMAYELLRNEFNLPEITVHLHKVIPSGSGLGGGSSDAATMLLLLNDLFKLQLSTEQLLSFALRLGSDCPFFIVNKPCYASGRGEILHPVNINLNGLYLVVVHPGITVNTKEAYMNTRPRPAIVSLKDLAGITVKEWAGKIINQFEESIFRQFPEIEKIKSLLYDQGAIYASLSGSGSAVYGLFEKQISAKQFFPSMYCWTGLIGG